MRPRPLHSARTRFNSVIGCTPLFVGKCVAQANAEGPAIVSSVVRGRCLCKQAVAAASQVLNGSISGEAWGNILGGIQVPKSVSLFVFAAGWIDQPVTEEVPTDVGYHTQAGRAVLGAEVARVA